MRNLHPVLERAVAALAAWQITQDEYDKKARELKQRQTETTLRIEIFWLQSSQCHRGVLSRALNTNWEVKLSIQFGGKGGVTPPT